MSTDNQTPEKSYTDMTTEQGGGKEPASKVVELFEQMMAVIYSQDPKPDSLVSLSASALMARSLCGVVLSKYKETKPEPIDGDPESIEAMQAWMEGYEDLCHMRSNLEWAMNYCTRQMNFRLMVLENEQERQEIMVCV